MVLAKKETPRNLRNYSMGRIGFSISRAFKVLFLEEKTFKKSGQSN